MKSKTRNLKSSRLGDVGPVILLICWKTPNFGVPVNLEDLLAVTLGPRGFFHREERREKREERREKRRGGGEEERREERENLFLVAGDS